MKTKAAIMVVFVTALLFGLYSSSALAKRPGKTKTKDIKVKVENPRDPATASLEITTKGTYRGCKASTNPGKGCIKVDRGEAADLVFDLTGNAKCDDDNDWELTGMQLGGYQKDKKPESDEWGNIPQDVADDFRADKVTGEAQVTFLNKDEMRVHNMNQKEYVIWYRLRASCKGNTIYSDPRVRNTGK